MRKPTPLERLSKPTPNKMKLYVIWPIAGAALVAGVVFAAVSLGVKPPQESAEPTRSKIVDGVYAKAVSLTNDEFIANIVATKIADCKFLANETSGWRFNNGLWHETKFEFLDDPSPGSTRPIGTQSFGLWKYEIKPGDTQVRTTVCHLCSTKRICTTIGPFMISSPKNSSPDYLRVNSE